ncbi:hypothetical protein Pan216_13670 [Planctomycetes bacterium Pan216]|uniref:DUF4398 domain-containing protein n=1 Tax=Kolteria novifilia TaxID=2527975 RepID=A0A518B0N6_9BACT|nr:hypothetical protein Pan216_13670 [Planctomycetes bacterium Pan216]
MLNAVRPLPLILLLVGPLGCSGVNASKFEPIFKTADDIETSTPETFTEQRSLFNRALSTLEEQRLSSSERGVVRLLEQAAQEWLLADIAFDEYRQATDQRQRDAGLAHATEGLERGSRYVEKAKQLVSGGRLF